MEKNEICFPILSYRECDLIVQALINYREFIKSGTDYSDEVKSDLIAAALLIEGKFSKLEWHFGCPRAQDSFSEIGWK